MFSRPTLFVLGAGASAEVGMPVGLDLAGKIRTMLDIRFADGITPSGSGDMDLFVHIRHSFRQEANAYQKAGWVIRDGIRLSHSIDDFLNLHSQDARVNLYGKAAIVKSVLEAERNSKLFRQHQAESIDLARLQDTWFENHTSTCAYQPAPCRSDRCGAAPWKGRFRHR
jgi:hypothetical protein